MKTLLLILISSAYSFSQKSGDNYIAYNNYASEAEYYFHEGMYDSSLYYFELSFQFVSAPHPTHHYKYAKALWKLNENKEALKEVYQNRGITQIDTNWFSGLSKLEYESINASLKKNLNTTKNVQYCRDFIDSLMLLDQLVRNDFDRNDSIKLARLKHQDSLNGFALIKFSLEYGFPAGKNTGWSQDAATILLHMSPEWFVENYSIMIKEVIKGNLEPWMLARGIDRMFAIKVGEDKISPTNRYYNESIIDPFLMFQNCIAMGVSPYYDYNWFSNPKKTIHFEYYKKNKQYYNTTVMYSSGDD